VPAFIAMPAVLGQKGSGQRRRKPKRGLWTMARMPSEPRLVPVGTPMLIDNPQKYVKQRIVRTDVEFDNFNYNAKYNICDKLISNNIPIKIYVKILFILNNLIIISFIILLILKLYILQLLFLRFRS
jgi:hypothetical protein